MCGTTIAPALGGKIWIGALVQFILSTTFMLIFGFPKIMIAIFAGMIVIGTALSARAKARALTVQPGPPRTVARPLLFRVTSLAVGLSSLVLFSCLLFGFVMFMNSWDRWHRYEGQRYERTEFHVKQVYFQRGSRGGVDVYANGTVDGNKEWMSLLPYLYTRPHDQGDLELKVPQGTTIPIYLFPNLKGRSRVEVIGDVPPAEGYRRAAMQALEFGSLGVVISAGVLFLLVRLRASCYDESQPSAAFGMSQGG